MCRVLDVAPNGYYEWSNSRSRTAPTRTEPAALIRSSFTASLGIYGTPRVFHGVREAGET